MSKIEAILDALAADVGNPEAWTKARAALRAAASTSTEAADNDFAEFEGVSAKELAETVARYGKALHTIASPSQSYKLLWWQIAAREALGLPLDRPLTPPTPKVTT